MTAEVALEGGPFDGRTIVLDDLNLLARYVILPHATPTGLQRVKYALVRDGQLFCLRYEGEGD